MLDIFPVPWSLVGSFRSCLGTRNQSCTGRGCRKENLGQEESKPQRNKYHHSGTVSKDISASISMNLLRRLRLTAFPQVPQLFGSVSTSVQSDAEHIVKPAGQTVAVAVAVVVTVGVGAVVVVFVIPAQEQALLYAADD